MFKPQPFRGCDDVKKERKNARQLHRQRLRRHCIRRGVKNLIAHWEINGYYYDFLVFCFQNLIVLYALHLRLSLIRWLETSHDDDRR